jgi:dihydroorotate dehydrogenase electron transfer subunit
VKSDHRAQLVRRRTFAPGVFSVTFEAPDLARAVLPGQFVMLEVPGLIRPYLRRAYSVADADASRGEVEFLVKTIGVGTAALENLPEGAEAGLLGPLGNAFQLSDLPRGARVAIVAGGIGAAPFPLLLRALGAARVTADVFLGGRNARELAIRDRFAGIGTGELVLASDDGSLGLRGFVTQAFAGRVDAGERYARLYACGPMPMFAALAPLAAARAVPAEFSTEAAMGCGFGACLGCVIPGTEKAFIVSCTDGPILAPEKIRW